MLGPSLDRLSKHCPGSYGHDFASTGLALHGGYARHPKFIFSAHFNFNDGEPAGRIIGASVQQAANHILPDYWQCRILQQGLQSSLQADQAALHPLSAFRKLYRATG